MSHSVAFHQCLHCLLRQNTILRERNTIEKEIQYFLEIITCDPSIYKMDHPELIVSNFMEKSFHLQRVKDIW